MFNQIIKIMKKLKFTKVGSLLLFVAIASMAVISGCKDDPVVVPTDFTALNAKITEAETLISSTEEGIADGQYPVGSQKTLQDAIDGAKAVAADDTSDQTAVDNTVISLQEKMDVYSASIIEVIDPTPSLVGHWKFDEGTGTTAADASSNGFNGTFQTGHSELGGGSASWGTDRFGNANKALVVDKGAWVEVPYNAALNPAEITVSLWVNATVLGGRFMGLQSWIGYKFEIPDHGRPFFTVATDPDNDVIINEDAAVAINAGEWIHLAVTYGGGEMVFYIDGDMARTVPDLSGDIATVSGHNLAIGVETSRFADTDVNYGDKLHEDYHIIPAVWASIYNGSLDELRIYKAVLSPAQIATIFESENP